MVCTVHRLRCTVHRLRYAVTVLLFAIWTIFGAPAFGQTIVVEATGIAFVANASDKGSARQRALVDALVTAALAGGAQMKGYTAQFNGRVVADMMLLQAAGRVTSHRVLSADLTNGEWRVKIVAQVGAPTATACSGTRNLTISATPPSVDIHPESPAWTAPIAGQLVQDVIKTLRAHPATTLDSVAPTRQKAISASFDYNTLTRGEVTSAAGNHHMSQTVSVTREGNSVLLALTIALVGSDGEQITRHFTRSTPIPSGGITGMLSNHNRRKAEQALRSGIIDEVGTALNQLVCQAPQAQLTLTRGELRVPIGKKHGLTRATIAVVEDPNSNFGLLNITALRNRDAVVKPLDPTQSLQSFDGTRVYFIEAGQ